MIDLSRWPALVLTAGIATRLRPLSHVRAKAALPVAGEALVCRILRGLAAAGITRVVLNLHHQAPTITSVVGDGSRFGLAVRYSWESPLLGSAGGPARALPLLEADRFFIVNGDTLADVDMAALAYQHVDTNAQVTMAVIAGRPGYNGVVADEHGLVRGFTTAHAPVHPAPLHPAPLHPAPLHPAPLHPAPLHPAPLHPAPLHPAPWHPAPWHFIGIQAVNASAFCGVSPHQPSETVKALYPSLIERRPGAVRVFATATEFFDIGTPADYLTTAIEFATRERRGLDRGTDCHIAPDAEVSDSVIWDRVTVESGARLTRCIVTDDVRVPAGASYAQCSLVMTDRGMIAEPWTLD
jgi:NDP-sugar pyrophosphorylase family protein